MTMTTISNDFRRAKPPIQFGDAGTVTAWLRRLLLRSLRGARGALQAAVHAWRASRAIHALEALDDRMLRDIGIVRSEIAYRVRQHKTALW